MYASYDFRIIYYLRIIYNFQDRYNGTPTFYICKPSEGARQMELKWDFSQLELQGRIRSSICNFYKYSFYTRVYIFDQITAC